jgi:hypothetical protein
MSLVMGTPSNAFRVVCDSFWDSTRIIRAAQFIQNIFLRILVKKKKSAQLDIGKSLINSLLKFC